MVSLRLIAGSLITLALALSVVPEAEAKSQDLCTVKERVKQGTKLDEKLRRKITKKAVRKALDSGYNYALISPLYAEAKDAENIDNVFLKELTRSYSGTVGCLALDDVEAFNRLWRVEAKPHTKGEGLVDLRQFAATLGLNGYGQAKPNISETHFRNIGDRERITAQYDVKLAATQCRQDLVPHQLSDFSQPLSPQQEAALTACLEPLRAEADRTGWTDFPLFRQEDSAQIAATGFRIVTPSNSGGATSASQNKNAFGGIPMDKKEWGENWYDHAHQFPGFTGRALVFYDKRAMYVIMASDDPKTPLWSEIAVYLMGKYNVQINRPAITLIDETERYTEAFNESEARLRHFNIPQTASSAEAGTKQAVFRALEGYDNVLAIDSFGYAWCRERDYICADALQAYNALGPRLNAADHVTFSKPKDWKTFDTTPK